MVVDIMNGLIGESWVGFLELEKTLNLLEPLCTLYALDLWCKANLNNRRSWMNSNSK